MLGEGAVVRVCGIRTSAAVPYRCQEDLRMWWCRVYVIHAFVWNLLRAKRSWLLYQSLFGVLQACRCCSSQFASDGKCLLPAASCHLYQAGVGSALAGALLWAPLMSLGRPQGARHQRILFSWSEFLLT